MMARTTNLLMVDQLSLFLWVILRLYYVFLWCEESDQWNILGSLLGIMPMAYLRRECKQAP